ncbi:MAG TPA: NAD-dependent epimerase/dehydratase family protein [Devosiaceae bacterium]|jgi:UDP-glucose 4-epimerase
MKVVVNGASGYIGRSLVPFLRRRGDSVVVLGRADYANPDAVIAGADAMVHLAAIAHTPAGSSLPYSDYDRVNHRLPIEMLEACGRSGVGKFIFMSSVSASHRPDTSYGKSKALAEQALLAMDGPELTILRPVLVYGQDAPGNFGALLRLCALPIPLPFGSASNRRSMVYLDNLLNAVEFALRNRLGSDPFVVTDDEALSVAEIVGCIRAGMGRSASLFRATWLPPLLRLAGRKGMEEQLFGELLFEADRLQEQGWHPPFAVRQGLELAAAR